MPPTLTMQDNMATVDKMSIWVAGISTPDQTATSADAVLTNPKVSTLSPRQEENLSANETEHFQKDIYEDINPLVRFTAARASHRPFEMLQQWEGVVSEVTKDSFCADLIDLTDRTRPEEVVELPLEEVSEADRSILKPGSVFYWAIGREWSGGGQMRRVSEIRFRRTPQWSQHSVDSIKLKAMALMERFNGNAQDTTATNH